MARLMWDPVGGRLYERGIDRGVLYPRTGDGVAWSGLVSVDVHPTGGTSKGYFIDGRKYLTVTSPEEYEATLKAYTYPDEFSECDGTGRVHSGLFATQQRRVPFGLSYRTMIGNELQPEYAYKIHILYNILAEPSQRTHNTLGESDSPLDLAWNLTGTPPSAPGYRPTVHFEIDTRSSNPSAVADVEAILFGTEEDPPRLPTLSELITVFDTYAVFSVTDNGDGSVTLDGPDDAFVFPDANTVQVTWPSVIVFDDDTYQMSSL